MRKETNRQRNDRLYFEVAIWLENILPGEVWSKSTVNHRGGGEEYTFKHDLMLNKFVKGNRNNFKMDFAIPSMKLCLEINGGQWVNGAHNRGGAGYERNLRKFNMLTACGWTPYAFTYEMLDRGEHFEVCKFREEF